MMNITKRWLVVITSVFLFANCKKSIDTVDVVINDTLSSLPVSAPFLENFESGSKNYWTANAIAFTRGIWRLDNAVTGTSADDKKIENQCIRIRENGSMRMNFNVINGVYSVIVSSASFGSDASSSWQLMASNDDGMSYNQVGQTVTTSAQLREDTFIISTSTKIRFAIQKISGGSNSINIDNFAVTLTPPPPTATGDDGNMLMGNPSNATANVLNVNNYLMDKGYYILSYSKDRGTPNWVSWHLHSPDLGNTPRQDDFRADPAVPSSWFQVQSTSYTGSGFDRGHNCPSGDRTIHIPANSSTFLMTNMIPQAPANNQTTWANLESYTRSLITAGNEAFIIMGSYGNGGTGSNGTFNTISNGNIAVPSNIWKVIVVLPNGTNDLARVNSNTRVIAVNTPNVNSINSDWKNYRVSVDSIEAATGLDLLSAVPASIQQLIEAKVDTQ